MRIIKRACWTLLGLTLVAAAFVVASPDPDVIGRLWDIFFPESSKEDG